MHDGAMRTCLDGEADVLLATAIVENGLDIPNANTLLVNRADRFGATPAQVDDLVAAQRLRVAARAAGIVTVARRGRDWRLQIAPDVGLPPGLTEALTSWQGARVSPAGEVVLPVASADPSADLPALRAALEMMAG
jgi:transcription-repair coupling factor (superfamily II helicase)